MPRTKVNPKWGSSETDHRSFPAPGFLNRSSQGPGFLIYLCCCLKFEEWADSIRVEPPYSNNLLEQLEQLLTRTSRTSCEYDEVSLVRLFLTHTKLRDELGHSTSWALLVPCSTGLIHQLLNSDFPSILSTLMMTTSTIKRKKIKERSCQWRLTFSKIRTFFLF